MQKLALRTKMYNHGDMANASHFGMITGIKEDKWGLHYQITPEMETGEEASDPYWISSVSLSPEFKGHSGTRIVTKEAYDKWRADQLKLFVERNS